ncbi:MAG: hypothetical protein KC646_11320 [Candidatus Cloacimonetes bacterium]|nr:hypothetical protein [Candidatus Cloacimonadota bacterium]
MKTFYITLFLLSSVNYFCIATGEFILKSGHYLKGGPLGINSNNVGTILLQDGIQRIPSRLFTKNGLKHFEYLSIKNKDFVITKTTGQFGFDFKPLDSFFALNQVKSKAISSIFVYINPDFAATKKVVHFVNTNRGFSSAASYFEKYVFNPTNTEEFKLIKQVMKAEFPCAVILNKNQSNEVHSNLNTMEDVLNLFKDLKSTLPMQTTTPLSLTTK